MSIHPLAPTRGVDALAEAKVRVVDRELPGYRG